MLPAETKLGTASNSFARGRFLIWVHLAELPPVNVCIASSNARAICTHRHLGITGMRAASSGGSGDGISKHFSPGTMLHMCTMLFSDAHMLGLHIHVKRIQ